MKKNIIILLVFTTFSLFCCFSICNAASASDSKMSPKDLITVMDEYLGLLVKNDPSGLPVARDVKVTENGIQTTNNPSTIATGCKEQFDKKVYSYITKIRNRRFLMADEEKGLVFGIVTFDMPGKRENFKYFPTPFDELPTRFYKPRSLLLAEMFKIVDGQILSIEAVMVNVPFGATSGW